MWTTELLRRSRRRLHEPRRDAGPAPGHQPRRPHGDPPALLEPRPAALLRRRHGRRRRAGDGADDHEHHRHPRRQRPSPSSANVLGKDGAGATTSRRVWVTYTFGNTGCHCWQSARPRPRRRATRPSGPATLDLGGADPDDLRFIVQAANGAALVGIDDNANAYHALAAAAAAEPAASSLDISAPSSGSGGTYGDTVAVSATLERDGTAARRPARQPPHRDGDPDRHDERQRRRLGDPAAPGHARRDPGRRDLRRQRRHPAVERLAALHDQQARHDARPARRPRASSSRATTAACFATLRDANDNTDPIPLGHLRRLGRRRAAPASPGRSRPAPTDGHRSGSLPAGLARAPTPCQAYYNGSITLDPWAVSPEHDHPDRPGLHPQLSTPARWQHQGRPDDHLRRASRTCWSPRPATSVSAIAIVRPAGDLHGPPVCTVAARPDALVHLTGAGSCTITANQAGDALLARGRQVTRTFTIVNPVPTVTSVVPGSIGRGAITFPLSVVGTGFVAGRWSRSPGTGVTLGPTSYVDATHLTVNISVTSGATARQPERERHEPGYGRRDVHQLPGPQRGPVRHRRRARRDRPRRGQRDRQRRRLQLRRAGPGRRPRSSSPGRASRSHSVTRVNSLLLTVNLSVDPGAATGARNVTVINPNGGRSIGPRRIHGQRPPRSSPRSARAPAARARQREPS